jgi:pimeloyl-ACP methyl ester carboxylesterase
MNWILDLFKKEKVNESCEDLPNIVWIHGANQTSDSFNYIRSNLPNWPSTLINYSSMNSFYNNLENIIIETKNKGPLFVIGHSLGGIYALHLTKHCSVIGGISISTPYRGSSAADWARFVVPGYQLFKDVGRKSRPVVEANNIEITIPWTQIVSVTGNVPYLGSPNDGVVTVASMKHREKDMECIEVPHTHYEVMCSKTVTEIIYKKYTSI